MQVNSHSKGVGRRQGRQVVLLIEASLGSLNGEEQGASQVFR